MFSNLLNESKKLYENFLKKRNSVDKEKFKTFTCLSGSNKQKSKMNYQHRFLITYGDDIQITWATIKEIVGSKKLSATLLQKRLVVNDLKIFNQKSLTKVLKNF